MSQKQDRRALAKWMRKERKTLTRAQLAVEAHYDRMDRLLDDVLGDLDKMIVNLETEEREK